MRAKICEKIDIAGGKSKNHVGPQWGRGSKMVENPSTWFIDAAKRKIKTGFSIVFIFFPLNFQLKVLMPLLCVVHE